MWTIEQYLERPMAVLRCTVCGVERMGNTQQAKKGALRCWTCSPRPVGHKPDGRPTVAERLSRPPPPPAAPKVATSSHEKPEKEVVVRRFPPGKQKRTPPPPKVAKAEIAGRVDSHGNAYSRAVRYQVETDEGVEHARIEIAGLRAKNPLNSRLAWQAVKAITAATKKGTMDALERCVERPDEGHDYAYEVRLTRISTKAGLDDDGVAAALKGARDAVAIFVRVNDGNRRRFRCSYGIGHARVQGVIVEWKRTSGRFEDEGIEEYAFFDRDEIAVLSSEHRITARVWKERMAKRMLSRAERVPGPGSDEAEEDAAYDADEVDDDEP